MKQFLRGIVSRSFQAAGIFLIRAYQILLSPILGGRCRFVPSCSHYGLEALRKYGFFKGSWLTLRRILACNPFGAHGFDPVPEIWPGFFSKIKRGGCIPPNQNNDEQKR